MRVSHILISAFAALMPALGALCDRACLKSWLDQYLQAILKHDPQAAFFGVLNEGAEPTVTTVRIRVQDRKITEAEWDHRAAHCGGDQRFRRASREELIAEKWGERVRPTSPHRDCETGLAGVYS